MCCGLVDAKQPSNVVSVHQAASSDVPPLSDKASSHDWPSLSLRHRQKFIIVGWSFNVTEACLILILNVKHRIILYTQTLWKCALSGEGNALIHKSIPGCVSVNCSLLFSTLKGVLFHFCLTSENTSESSHTWWGSGYDWGWEFYIPVMLLIWKKKKKSHSSI